MIFGIVAFPMPWSRQGKRRNSLTNLRLGIEHTTPRPPLLRGRFGIEVGSNQEIESAQPKWSDSHLLCQHRAPPPIALQHPSFKPQPFPPHPPSLFPPPPPASCPHTMLWERSARLAWGLRAQGGGWGRSLQHLGRTRQNLPKHSTRHTWKNFQLYTPERRKSGGVPKPGGVPFFGTGPDYIPDPSGLFLVGAFIIICNRLRKRKRTNPKIPKNLGKSRGKVPKGTKKAKSGLTSPNRKLGPFGTSVLRPLKFISSVSLT